MGQQGEHRDVVVVGAGIGGLSAAYRLQQQGRDVLVLEGSPQVGGVLRRQTSIGTVGQQRFDYITQSLGGAYTVRSPQGLFRVDACDADALGFAVSDEAKSRESDEPATEQEVWDSLKQVYDPEIPVNIYDLGLIYTVDISPENEVKIVMTLTAPGCPVAGDMPGWVADAVEPLDGVKQVDVALTWEPPWGMDMMSDEARLELGFM